MQKKDSDEYESKKHKIDEERILLFLQVLLDIRHIQLCKIPFRDSNSMQEFIQSLPSYREKYGEQKKSIATCTKLDPGEIPDWLIKAREKQKK